MIQSSLADYCEVVIRFGFNSLFSSALPISSLLALIANAIEIRCDGWKLMNAHQRPFPRGCEDIGSWFVCITITNNTNIKYKHIIQANNVPFHLDCFCCN